MTENPIVGSRVLVTGAAKGLGRLFAQRAVAEGAAAVVAWDVDADALAATADELRGGQASVHTAVVDIASQAAVSAAAEQVRADLGGIDVLINNAGIVRGNTYFWESSDTDITATMGVNALAPMYVTREFLPGMVAGDRSARVVNIASMAGFLTTPRLSVYHGSKWAAVGWSDSVRLELEQAGHRHVKLTTVCPGYIDTGMFDGVGSVLLAPILQPEDVVNRTWRALLAGEAFVVMPFMSKVGRALQNLLPTGIRDVILDRIGLHHSMEQFRGH